MGKILVFLAEGFEEIEALTVVDLCRRAGIKVTTVAIGNGKEVTGSHGIQIRADVFLGEIDLSVDMLVLPGGMPGTKNLSENKELENIINKANARNLWIAAICAAPTVLGERGLLMGRRACCYPGMEEKLLGAKVNTDAVNIDGHFITSRGLGTAIPFALNIISVLNGSEEAEKIGKSIVYF